MRSLIALSLLLASNAVGAPLLRREVLSDIYTIDRQYKSMEGPSSVKPVYLSDGEPELLWLVGVKTEMVAADGKTAQLPEFMCHVNVDYDADRHRMLFNANRNVSRRVVTLSQSVLSVRVPEGFGYPVASNEPLQLFTQVLNHNIPNPGNLKVRHRVTFEYVRDRDLKKPMTPLLNVGISGMVLLNEKSNAGHGATCLIAPRAPNALSSSGDYIDPQGRKFTGHWVVPPGRQVNHSDVTWFMDLPFDTKLHFAAVHLHPFAESLTLRDVTANKTIFAAKAQNPAKGVGLASVDSFASNSGVQLYKSHQYELVSVYNNPTKTNHDSMASLFLGVVDESFAKPTRGDLAARVDDAQAPSYPDTALLETTAGGIGVTLLPQQAPGMTRQFARLVREGSLSGARVTKIARGEDSITIYFAAPAAAQRLKVFRNLPSENASKDARVALAVCGATADSVTFAITMGKVADARCKVFGRIAPGAQSLDRIASAKVDANGRPLEKITVTSSSVYERGVKLPPL